MLQVSSTENVSKGGYSYNPITEQRVHNGRPYWKFKKKFTDELIPVCKLDSQGSAKITAVTSNIVFKGIIMEPERIFVGIECDANKSDSISVCASDLEKKNLEVARLWITVQGSPLDSRERVLREISISTRKIPAFKTVEKLEFFTKDSENRAILFHECEYKPVPPNGSASECGWGYNPVKESYIKHGRRSFKFDKSEKHMIPIHKVGLLFHPTALWNICNDMVVKNVQHLSDRIVLNMSCTIGTGDYLTVTGADLKKTDQDSITLWITMSGYEHNREKHEFTLNVSTVNVPAFKSAKSITLKTMHGNEEVTLAKLDCVKP